MFCYEVCGVSKAVDLQLAPAEDGDGLLKQVDHRVIVAGVVTHNRKELVLVSQRNMLHPHTLTHLVLNAKPIQHCLEHRCQSCASVQLYTSAGGSRAADKHAYLCHFVHTEYMAHCTSTVLVVNRCSHEGNVVWQSPAIGCDVDMRIRSLHGESVVTRQH